MRLQRWIGAALVAAGLTTLATVLVPGSASAYFPQLTGVTSCADTTWTVTWTLGADPNYAQFQWDVWSPAGYNPSGPQPGTVVRTRVASYPLTQASATESPVTVWHDGSTWRYTSDISATVQRPPTCDTTTTTTQPPTTTTTTQPPPTTTTTTTEPPTTTTQPATTTTQPATTTTQPATTTTQPATTTTQPATTTTQPATTTTQPATTTTEGQQLPPLLPSTTQQPTTTVVSGALPPTGLLPATGASRSSSTLATGAVLLIAGLAFLLLSRRQARS